MTSAEEVASALANILKKCNIETVNSDVVNVTSKGDGYLGLLWSAKVTTRDSSDKVLHLVLKVTNNALEAGDIISPQVFFRREAYVYEIVFPTFEKLQCAIRTKNAFTSYPKLYGTSLKNTKEMLVMEDLKMRGYQMWNRLTPMDKDHISRVMEEYGRFHALSYLLRDQKPLEFKQVTQSLDDVLANLISTDWVVVYESACIKVAEMLELNGYSKASEKIEQMKDEVMDILTSYAKKDDKYSVILHGDCWCNNIMFKYEDHGGSSRLSNVCFIDWQLSRMGSPVLDLLYYFFACASESELHQMDLYLQKYYNSLSLFLRDAGSDPDVLFPYKTLMEHVKDYCKYGLLLTMVVLKITLTDKDETPEVSKDGLQNAVKKTIRRQDIYEKRIRDIVLYLEDKELI